MPYVLERETRLTRDMESVFPFFADAANLERITPPELNFRIRSRLPIGMQQGAEIEYTIRLYGIPLTWRTLITRWNPPYSFEDTQVSGPYRMWVHTHAFRRDGDDTIMTDRVTYDLPLGFLGRLFHPLIRRQLARIFDYRAQVISRIFAPLPQPQLRLVST